MAGSRRRRACGVAVAAGIAGVSGVALAGEPPATAPTPTTTSTTTTTSTSTAGADEPFVPRIDGPYLGAVLFAGVTLTRVNDLETDGPFAAFGGTLRFGEMVLPWLGLGLQIGGSGGVRSQDDARQGLGQGLLAVDFDFVPAPKRLNLQLRASFGFGGGAIQQAGTEGRSGYGGAVFGAAARYEWFPWAKRLRRYRGGGFGLGPELGWIGFTPAAPGRPMAHTIYLALTTTFYFGS